MLNGLNQNFPFSSLPPPPLPLSVWRADGAVNGFFSHALGAMMRKDMCSSSNRRITYDHSGCVPISMARACAQRRRGRLDCIRLSIRPSASASLPRSDSLDDWENISRSFLFIVKGFRKSLSQTDGPSENWGGGGWSGILMSEWLWGRI